MQTNCPTFIIHLDAPPEKRWRKVIEHYKEYIPDASSIACKLLGATTVKLLTPLLRLSFRSNMIMYKEELQAIATKHDLLPACIFINLWHGSQQRTCIRVLGILENVRVRALFHQSAKIHHADPISHVTHDAQIMCDEQVG